MLNGSWLFYSRAGGFSASTLFPDGINNSAAGPFILKSTNGVRSMWASNWI